MASSSCEKGSVISWSERSLPGVSRRGDAPKGVAMLEGGGQQACSSGPGQTTPGGPSGLGMPSAGIWGRVWAGEEQPRSAGLHAVLGERMHVALWDPPAQPELKGGAALGWTGLPGEGVLHGTTGEKGLESLPCCCPAVKHGPRHLTSPSLVPHLQSGDQVTDAKKKQKKPNNNASHSARQTSSRSVVAHVQSVVRILKR